MVGDVRDLTVVMTDVCCEVFHPRALEEDVA